ncbi:MAG: hypothetical protein D6730_14625 [Bacteroidetes bacterium]|nr:MAG: hypothetical protein D6730_14625 [Bacteroidota bacterium]
MLLFTACFQETHEGTLMLSEEAKSWIPFNGGETRLFVSTSGDTLDFQAGEKTSFFNTVQIDCKNGLFVAKCRHADVERQVLTFSKEGSPYTLDYLLHKEKDKEGEYDVLEVMLRDENYGRINIIKDVYWTGRGLFGPGTPQDSLVLNGNTFYEVYVSSQEQPPLRLFLTQQQGVVGFVLNQEDEVWTLNP